MKRSKEEKEAEAEAIKNWISIMSLFIVDLWHFRCGYWDYQRCSFVIL